MNQYFCLPVIAQGANDIFIRIGWCPDLVRITEWATGLGVEWYRAMGNDVAITRAAAGDRTVQSGQGIKLVKFTDVPHQLSADPSEVEAGDWANANGIQLTSDLTGLTDHAVLMVECFRISCPFVRAVHDGTTSANTYFEDSSIDFKENGVQGGQKWILFNVNNTNYAHIGAVQKPAGQSKYCRLTLVDSGGTAMTLADSDTGDVAIIMPKDMAQYPLSDYGHMT
jgi:hypothetical protein